MMPQERSLPVYPLNCFGLSPTTRTYCPLRASDIESLPRYPRLSDDQRYFILHNHPIKWVRIAGMVVAVDEYPGRRVYTVDDSSGVCIECLVEVPKLPPPAGVTTSRSSSKDGSTTTTTAADTISQVPEGVDVGTIVDIKGELALFRDHKQVKILKTTILGSTEQEVAFWEKLRSFRRDVLEKPWELTQKQVRRCRKDEERRRFFSATAHSVPSDAVFPFRIVGSFDFGESKEGATPTQALLAQSLHQAISLVWPESRGGAMLSATSGRPVLVVADSSEDFRDIAIYLKNEAPEDVGLATPCSFVGPHQHDVLLLCTGFATGGPVYSPALSKRWYSVDGTALLF